MKLYELTENYQNLTDLLTDPELAQNDAIIQALDSVKDDFNTKAVQTVYAIKNIESDIDAIDAEIKRLQALKKSRKNAIESVKDYLKINMNSTGIKKIECPYFKISYSERANSKLELDEQAFLDAFPDESLIKITIEPNKEVIKQRLKLGEEITGAKLVDSQVLTIR